MNIFRIAAAMLLALAVSLASAAPASTGADGVRARLADVAVLRGKFEQEKRLQGFRNPLRSQGDFLLSRERGVVWNTRSPFASTLVLTRQRLQAKQGDGRKQDLLEPGNSQALATANTLLLALIGGDVAALRQQFVLKETLAADGSWQLELLPKSGGLRKVFRRIELQGDRFVRRVSLEEVRGDRTDIRFQQLLDTPPRLSAEEAKQFD